MLSFKISSVLTIMSVLSVIVFLIILLVTAVKSDLQNDNHQTTTVQNFKKFVTNIIKEQSTKVQTLFDNIQKNAKKMLKKLDSVNNYNRNRFITNDGREQQIETPELSKSNLQHSRSLQDYSDSLNRNYGSYTTGYGAPSNNNNNHGALTYHHHSIGFDPVNIVLSMSLLSFLLQAIQGILSRVTMPTTVVEARNAHHAESWLRNYEKKMKMKPIEIDKYMKRKYQKLKMND